MDAKEKLINKWLKGELSPEEQKSFENLDEYNSYIKLSEKATSFKAPSFDADQSMLQLNKKINSHKKNNSPWYSYIAAAVVVVFIISFAFVKTLSSKSNLQTFETDIAKTEFITLPDFSQVNLNAKSKLSFQSSNWDSNRELELDGEAFFDVESGNTFTVKTNYGEIEVVGTVFNVKSRPYTFEVTCYEGAVRVNINDKTAVLKANDVLTLNGNIHQINKTEAKLPAWKENRTVFESKPLAFVLEELKIHYNVEFNTENVDVNQLYTGNFAHDDVEFALKSITLPLGLSYTIGEKEIILSVK